MVKRNLFSKILSSVIVLVMVLSLVACGENKPTQSSESVQRSSEQSKSSETESAQSQQEEREHVELVWYTFVGSVSAGEEATVNAINEYLKEKLNTTIDFHFYRRSEYSESVGTIFNSGTYMDCLVSGSARMPFSLYGPKNAFMPLDDYIDEYLPKTKEMLPENAWEAYSIDGVCYGIPPVKDLATNFCWKLNQTMLNDLGIEFPEKYDTLWDTVDFLYEVKKARDTKYPDKTSQPIFRGGVGIGMYYYMEPFVGTTGTDNVMLAANVPGLFGFEGMGDGETVFCPYYTEEYIEYAKLMRQLVVDGIAPFDTETFDPDKVLSNGGELIGEISSGLVYVNPDEQPGFKTSLAQAENSVLTTVSLQADGFVIPANAKNVERTLEVIELLNTDQYLATVIRFGPEGEGWTDKDNDGVIEYTEKNSDPKNRYWYNWYGWNLGAFPTSKVVPGVPANYGDLVNELNQSATAGANLGFLFDQTPVANEMAACNNVYAEYHNVIKSGQNDNVEELVSEFVAKLKSNGMDKVIEECQKQLDDWRIANAK